MQVNLLNRYINNKYNKKNKVSSIYYNNRYYKVIYYLL